MPVAECTRAPESAASPAAAASSADFPISASPRTTSPPGTLGQAADEAGHDPKFALMPVQPADDGGPHTGIISRGGLDSRCPQRLKDRGLFGRSRTARLRDRASLPLSWQE